MEITLTTPAILFPAVSLLLIAYTNRYLAIARLLRELKTTYVDTRRKNDLEQIRLLKKRERYIRNMQTFAIASLFSCTLSMTLIYLGENTLGGYFFGMALFFMLFSLGISLRDILIAGGALKIELKEMEEELEKE